MISTVTPRTTPIVYQDQNANDLRLYVAGGYLDPGQFQGLSNGKRRIGDYQVEATIIGASHHLVVRCGEDEINEVLACVEAHGGSAIARESLRGILSTSYGHHHGGLLYEFNMMRLTSEEGQPYIDGLEWHIADPAREDFLGLRVDFPAAEPGAPVPKTLVLATWEDKQPRVVFQTIHSYPSHNQVVVTRTAIHHN